MNWEQIGQFAAAFVAVVWAFSVAWKNYSAMMPKPPSATPPPPVPKDEVRLLHEAYDEYREGHRELRDIVQRNHALLNDDIRDIVKVLDRLENSHDRLERGLDRLEASQRKFETLNPVRRE